MLLAVVVGAAVVGAAVVGAAVHASVMGAAVVVVVVTGQINSLTVTPPQTAPQRKSDFVTTESPSIETLKSDDIAPLK